MKTKPTRSSMFNVGSWRVKGCHSPSPISHLPSPISSLFLPMLLMLLTLSAVVQAQFNYTTNDGTITITKYTGSGGAVTVPDTINGLPVTSIGDYALYGCTSLTGAYFQGNAPSLGSSVFYGADAATVYYLPGTTGWGTTFGGRPAALWLLPNPLILNHGLSFGMQTNGFGFIISWATNISIVVEACTNLAHPTWFRVGTNTLTDGASYFSDPEWTNYPGRFYRLRSL
jgi:hypothetical protein